MLARRRLFESVFNSLVNFQEEKEMFKTAGYLRVIVPILLLLAIVPAAAQSSKKAYPVKVSQGEKVKLQGVVSVRDNDMFKVRDPGGAETTVIMTSDTKVSSHSRGLR